MLYRKSLIHYAHATSWAEAVDLLDRVPSLKTAITERFKLYLRVCHTAGKDINAASRLVRKHVQQRRIVLEEDVEGNMVEKTRTSYNEEELDLLRNYPFEQAHLLPPEPFLGRVTAASTHISRDLRRSRTQYEHQFRQAMQGSSPSMDEIYEIAKNAAEEGAFEGLMYLERAQNSTKFSITARNRLAGVEQSLFSQYKDDIPTSKRRFLHNLSLTPLVIVDTNVLVDALVERMYQRMNLVLETNVNIIGANQFHRILLHHAQAKRLVMMIPEDVRGELKQFAKDQRLLPRFKSAMVDASTLEETLNEKAMMKLVEEVLSEYSTWSPSAEMLAGVPETSDDLNTFLIRHSDVFEELTELKGYRGITYRTELEGREIYPESTDLDVYRLATHLASLPLPNIGAVLVATMDGDFTLVDRAIEERFGFSVAKNHRSLKPWLKRQSN
jgi:PAS domain-containing protein